LPRRATPRCGALRAPSPTSPRRARPSAPPASPRFAQIPPAEAQRFLSAGANLAGAGRTFPAPNYRAMHTAQRIHSALERGTKEK
jgi:hypothetical protein